MTFFIFAKFRHREIHFRKNLLNLIREIFAKIIRFFLFSVSRQEVNLFAKQLIFWKLPREFAPFFVKICTISWHQDNFTTNGPFVSHVADNFSKKLKGKVNFS
jgi:hypothetical protein